MSAHVRPNRRPVDADAPRHPGDRHGQGRDGSRGLDQKALLTAQPPLAAEPEEILSDLLRLDPGLVRQPYYGEHSIFYNPGRVAPLGTIVASIKDRDGPNDKSSNLSRAGVFRFAFQLGRDEYEARFGSAPARPAKGQAVDVGAADVTRLGELAPHPVYAWMRWVQILSPTRAQYEALQPLVLESLTAVKARWKRRSS